MGKRLCGWWWKSDVEGFFNQKMLSRENICSWPDHFLLLNIFKVRRGTIWFNMRFCRITPEFIQGEHHTKSLADYFVTLSHGTRSHTFAFTTEIDILENCFFNWALSFSAGKWFSESHSTDFLGSQHNENTKSLSLKSREQYKFTIPCEKYALRSACDVWRVFEDEK